MSRMTVGVPSGIGDVSWMYSKLKHVPGGLDWQVADGWPYRTKPFLKLLPQVHKVSYGQFQYPDIAALRDTLPQPLTWEALSTSGQTLVLLDANLHLELGRRLEDWLPDLACDFHYSIPTTVEDRAHARKLLAGYSRPLFGISAASYRGSEAWHTWRRTEWLDFLGRFKAHVGGTCVLLGGFWDDLTAELSEAGYPDLVGKTSIGSAVEVLKQLDGYLGFSSGLGILGTVLHRPVFMLWPLHQQALSTSWAPPEMLEDGTYIARPWLAPDTIMAAARRWLQKCGI